MTQQLAAAAVFLMAHAAFGQAPPAYKITTVAGGIEIPFPTSAVTTANVRLFEPQHTASDAQGNLYLSEAYYNRILKISPDGSVESIAGGAREGFSGDGGPAIEALLNAPEALAFAADGSLVFCDSGNRRIRKISPDGIITTIAGNGQATATGDGGPATAASIGLPWGIAIDAAGSLFFSDATNGLIRRIVPTGNILTVAGTTRGYAGDNGPALQARLLDPRGIAVDGNGVLYIADAGNNRVRTVSGGIIRTLAGNGNTGLTGDNGPATAATLTFPFDVKVGSLNTVFIADRSNGLLRRVLSSGVISTIRGGVPMSLPTGLSMDGNGGLIVVDNLRRQVLRFDLSTLSATVLIKGVQESAYGDGGPAAEAALLEPWGIALDAEGNVYVSDTRDSRVRRVSIDGTITTVAGNGAPEQSGDNGLATQGGVGAPRALTFDSAGNLLITTAIQGGFIRGVDPAGTLSTVAGRGGFGFGGDGGPANQAIFFGSIDMAFDNAGNLFIADAQNHRVRRISAEGIVSTVAGSGTAGFAGDGGPASAAQLSFPSGVTVDPQGRLVIADTGNNRVRRVEPDGSIVTIGGTGAAALGGEGEPASTSPINAPRALRYDANGYLLLPLPSRIRVIAPDGNMYTIAGPGGATGENAALGATIANAVSLATAPDGAIYIVETAGRRVRKLEVAAQP